MASNVIHYTIERRSIGLKHFQMHKNYKKLVALIETPNLTFWKIAFISWVLLE